ncbi:MAG: HAMP domain-containing protein [Candidatus Thermoplasmatota archaeon]|nr:HAMP domain-containing protein [Candidatus Thermoplasmatota archaeon]
MQNQNLMITSTDEFNEIQSDYQRLVETDVKVLSSTLESITFNENLKQYYLNEDREGLYEYGQPLFQQLKENYGITHFYFIRPNSHCFLRLHNKDIYNDSITRFTYRNANDTYQTSSGIELGKTAFALRVVKPYYNGSRLIGFVELGQEINHFFDILKGETNNEYAVIVEKQFLDEKKWASVQSVKGVVNNWNQLEKHVILFDTIDVNTEKNSLSEIYFTDDYAERIEDSNFQGEIITHEDRTYVFNGFPIVDAGNRQVGTICALIDISEHMIGYQQSIIFLIILLILMVVFVIVIGYLLSKSLSKPITKLKNASMEMAEGNLDVSVDIHSKDEIGDLGKSFNDMRLKIKSSSDEIHKLLNQKDAFIDQLGHDLSHPLGPLINLIPLLKKGENDEKRKQIIIIIERNVSYLKHLVKRTVQLTKLNAPSTTFNYKSIHVSDFLNKIIEKKMDLFDEHDIEIKQQVNEDILLHADEQQIAEVFDNLFSNAVKYGAENGSISINVEKQDEQFAIISVEDTGDGMNEEQLTYAFHEFYKADESRHDFNDTGLGLSICKRIIEKHGGQIWVESPGNGEGSTFYFTLPKSGHEP